MRALGEFGKWLAVYCGIHLAGFALRRLILWWKNRGKHE